LRSFEKRLPEFAPRGVQIVAVSTDPPEDMREHVARMGWTFIALADPEAEVVRAYDLLHPGGGPRGDIARPAELLIDPLGTVRWRDLTGDYWVRARPDDVLEALDRLSHVPPDGEGAGTARTRDQAGQK
jgi:peroxiredoxin